MAVLSKTTRVFMLLLLFWSCEELQPPANPLDPINALSSETTGDSGVDDPTDDLPPVVDYGENEPFHYVTIVYESWPDYGFIDREFQAVYWADNDLSVWLYSELGFKSAGYAPISWVDVMEGSWVSADLSHSYDVMYTKPESFWYDIPRIQVRSESYDGVQGPVLFRLQDNPYDKTLRDVQIATDDDGAEMISLRTYIEAESSHGTIAANSFKIEVADIPHWQEFNHLKMVYDGYESSFFRFR